MTAAPKPLAKRRTVSLPEAAAILGISENTAYRLAARDGRLCAGVPALRVGRQLRVGIPALDRATGKTAA